MLLFYKPPMKVVSSACKLKEHLSKSQDFLPGKRNAKCERHVINFGCKELNHTRECCRLSPGTVLHGGTFNRSGPQRARTRMLFEIQEAKTTTVALDGNVPRPNLEPRRSRAMAAASAAPKPSENDRNVGTTTAGMFMILY
uniref:Uncharacterized protein n=1 Tax=Anopheles atroparvus TaxID=41427 RepID=A0AAG5CQ17_ANOAO